ncbi:MAG: glutamine--fructose-6-phosphate aminotransferase [Ignavibacteria bacterium GWA2_55_11]|nr:MAG: glutamine--fructose-6-phosphate aminotransferase [Ignavibacteria bacterium GWA2_55_11]OGU63538.1 MAG: glutamine--fructose-6-phosphate aminotransferase [Ignavibacteria bacterium RIFCSPHIGHO2_02_FULL_56_12]OGU74506.1 MAG: glutamine--fructose-6-phosphate aminotransferase [Ignavibacteria bacterium RIFCSPLOWO2_02_FULL_55_14]
MCGIVGYLGFREPLPIILDGLRRLEYRGYDSAGVALNRNGCITVRKSAGKVAELAAQVESNPEYAGARAGMGHSRWATHGEPNDVNAHPHVDCTGRVAVIHNGIIENYAALKTQLQHRGHVFASATDTEVLAHLVEDFLRTTPDLYGAVKASLREVRGTYGLVVMDAHAPEVMIAARMGSPLIIGVGEGEHIIASDAAAIVAHTRQVVYLNDGEVSEVRPDGMRTSTIFDVPISKEITNVTIELSQIERGGYEHFMLKEIHEQPETIRNGMRGRLRVEDGEVKLGGLEHVRDKLVQAKRIVLIGCGTSWHAGLVGEYMLEQIAKVPVEVEYASEYRYRSPLVGKDDVVFLISQSGETADTLAALREAKRHGATVLGIVNVVGSTIPRETDGGMYVHAGPEIGVASTKAFTSQLTALGLITIMIARAKGLPREEANVLTRELASIPDKVARVLAQSDAIKQLAQEFKDSRNFLFLGRGANFPVALEGALKLKEISYIHAEGYPAAEMKHGPIALIDEHMPVVFVVPKDAIYEKVLSNIHEVRARKGQIIAIANEDDTEIDKLADHVIRVPRTYGFFGPIVNVIPLQLLAYYIAVARGTNVDQPRNLAKSVTVE